MTNTQRPIRRRDASGHIDPKYARELLAKARENPNDDDKPEAMRAFLRRPKTSDDFAEGLGEAFIEGATSGEDAEPSREDETTEEQGGPFVTTSGQEEFASGTDESNIAEATREPLPRTSKAEP